MLPLCCAPFCIVTWMVALVPVSVIGAMKVICCACSLRILVAVPFTRTATPPHTVGTGTGVAPPVPQGKLVASPRLVPVIVTFSPGATGTVSTVPLFKTLLMTGV